MRPSRRSGAGSEPIGFKHFGGRTNFLGKIATVQCYEDNSLLRAALEQNGSGKVLVVDGGGSLRCALLGGDIAALADRNQWNGILVHGCIRDSSVVSAINLGIVALGTNPRRSGKRNQSSVSSVLHFAGIDFAPGTHI